MFMSWASPRSIPGAFGLNRFATARFGSAGDHNHKHGSGLWSKLCYALSIVLLASILWIWAIVIHDIIKTSILTGSKLFYILAATLVAGALFMIIVYLTMTFRHPRKPSNATQTAHVQHDHNEAERRHEDESKGDIISPV